MTIGRGGEGPPTRVFLHGYGSNAEDWDPFTRTIAAPANTRFVFPEAPETTVPPDGPLGGRAWWRLDLESHLPPGRKLPDLSATHPPGIDVAAASVRTLLHDVSWRSGGPIVLGGFSQGAMVASDLAFTSSDELAALVLLSGTPVDVATWRRGFASRRGLPVFVSHGRADAVLSFAAAERFQQEPRRRRPRKLFVTWVPLRRRSRGPRPGRRRVERLPRADPPREVTGRLAKDVIPRSNSASCRSSPSLRPAAECRLPRLKRGMFDAVHEALVACFRNPRPRSEGAQRFAEYAPEDFEIPPGRGERFDDRDDRGVRRAASVDAKRALYKTIADRFEAPGVPRRDVFIVLNEGARRELGPPWRRRRVRHRLRLRSEGVATPWYGRRVRALALWVSVLLTVATAVVAALLILPPPTTLAWHVALFFDEKTPLLVAGVLAAAVTARLSGSSRWRVVQACSGSSSSASRSCRRCSLRVAVKRHVAIDFSRYVRAPVDDGALAGTETRVYATVDGKALSLDVYRPATTAGPPTRHPAILVLHEGGWSAGDKGSAARMSQWLASRGWAVFDAQYRLAPQPNWQTAIGDVKCAIGWVKRRARDIGIEVDANRVTLLGRSAGAHLAMLAAYDPDDPALPPSCDAGDTRVASVISYYGPTDLAWGWAHTPNPRVFDMRQRVANYLGGTPSQQPERYRLLSPITHVTASSPPTLLIHGGRDNLVPVENTALMDRQLAIAGVRHDVLIIPYAQHGFDFIFGGLGEQLAEHAVLEFLGTGR